MTAEDEKAMWLRKLRGHTAEDLAAMAYRLARHIRNTDKSDAVKWGLEAIDLLSELRELDLERYDREVK